MPAQKCLPVEEITIARAGAAASISAHDRRQLGPERGHHGVEPSGRFSWRWATLSAMETSKHSYTAATVPATRAVDRYAPTRPRARRRLSDSHVATQEPPSHVSDDPHRLPERRPPDRYDLELEPDLDAAHLHGRGRPSTSTSSRPTDTDRAARPRPGDPPSGRPSTTARRRPPRSTPTRRRSTPARSRRRGCRRATAPRSSSAFTGRAQRPARRLLPLDLHRRTTARDAHPGHHPVRGHPRPPGLPVLGRAGVQGRRSASPSWSPDGLLAVVQRAPRSAREPLRRRPRSRVALRRHHGRCPPTWWPSWSARSRSPTRSTWATGRSRCGSCTRRARAHLRRRSPSRSAPSALRFFDDYYEHPLPGRQARPGRHPRLRLRRHGEPRLHHLPRGAAAGRPGDAPPSPSCSAWPTSSPTSSPTCGSATW